MRARTIRAANRCDWAGCNHALESDSGYGPLIRRHLNYILGAAGPRSLVTAKQQTALICTRLIAVHLFVVPNFGINGRVRLPVGRLSFARRRGIRRRPESRHRFPSVLTNSLRTAALPFPFIFNYRNLLLIDCDFWQGNSDFIVATSAMRSFAAGTQGWNACAYRWYESLLIAVVVHAVAARVLEIGSIIHTLIQDAMSAAAEIPQALDGVDRKASTTAHAGFRGEIIFAMNVPFYVLVPVPDGCQWPGTPGLYGLMLMQDGDGRCRHVTLTRSLQQPGL